MRLPSPISLALFLCALPSVAEVKIAVREDGIKVVYNEGLADRARRMARRLLPIPEPKLAELISTHSASQKLDPRLVQAVIQVESGYNPRALSNKGAMGLMQLMPGTASLLAVGDAYDPAENVRGGTSYLRRLLDLFRDNTVLALAAYNAGPKAVEKYGGVPPYRETEDYVRHVLQLYRGEDAPLPSGQELPGRPVFMVRDANNQIRLTTLPAER